VTASPDVPGPWHDGRVELAQRFASIGIDRDYSDLDLSGLEVDLQGWGAGDPIFEQVIREVEPGVVIEVGSWKGASLVRMHELRSEAQFICVDTWLGSPAQWLSENDRPWLRLRGGYPDLYRQFIFNVLAAGADVFPLPMTSAAGAEVLERLGVVADLVYIDGSHEEANVKADLSCYWKLLRSGGIIFGDDYQSQFPGVVRAVDSFSRKREVQGQKWLVRKR
jgi:methyltransferase family protein